MKKFVTLVDQNYNTVAFDIEEKELWLNALKSAHEWVFQLANSRLDAIQNHNKKFDRWQSDVENGVEEKDFY